ncbi:hypothetical protein [Psychromarinibacter sp. S121]|uniref:hypothetical protein n=1 Tax=Psychromarinibacter sp. S121 TaxID=3415127 RepID=UPI003C7CEEF8
MNYKYTTAALCAFFADHPDGDYNPRFVRHELAISTYDWRCYARDALYPEGSLARKELAKIGVTITSNGPDRSMPNGRHLRLSRFTKATQGEPTV